MSRQSGSVLTCRYQSIGASRQRVSAAHHQMFAEPGDWIEAYMIGAGKVRSEVAGTAPPLMRVLPWRGFLLQ